MAEPELSGQACPCWQPPDASSCRGSPPSLQPQPAGPNPPCALGATSMWPTSSMGNDPPNSGQFKEGHPGGPGRPNIQSLAAKFPSGTTWRDCNAIEVKKLINSIIYPDSPKTREKFLVFFGLADSAPRMIRVGFLTEEDRGKLVALARDGSAASRLTRRANAALERDPSLVKKWLKTEFPKIKKAAETLLPLLLMVADGVPEVSRPRGVHQRTARTARSAKPPIRQAKSPRGLRTIPMHRDRKIGPRIAQALIETSASPLVRNPSSFGRGSWGGGSTLG
jgi:hypothetical protein